MCKLKHRCWCARGEDVSFTDVKIKSQIGLGDVNDVMHWKRAHRILGDLKKVSELSLAVRRRTVTFASSQWPCGGCHTCWGGGRWKSQHRKIVPLSPYVKKSLNSKVIKSFIPELRSRKCFSCFGIPMFYVYMLWTFYVRFTYLDIWLCYMLISIYLSIYLSILFSSYLSIYLSTVTYFILLISIYLSIYLSTVPHK